MSEHAMHQTDDVISAFIDNEPFDPQALGRALAEPGGRDLLLDLIALRHVVAADLTDEARLAGAATSRARWRILATAAALVVAIGGGYAIGHRVAARNRAAASDIAPAPTRVIELKPGVDWHQTGGGH